MTEKRRAFTSHLSLKLYLIIFILIGAIGAVLVFGALRFVINRFVDTVYMSEQNKKAREENYIADFQKYIENNGISSDDTSKLGEWVMSQRYVYMLIYKDDELFFASDDYNKEPDDTEGTEGENPPDASTEESEGGSSGSKGEDAPDAPGGSITVIPPSYEQLKEYAEKNNLHPIQLEDGTVFARLTEFSEYLYYDISNIASIIAAMLVFSVVIVIFFIRIVGKISRLAQDVNRVSGGDMDYSIKSSGRDEISRLSQDVDKMRSTILYNFKKEREAREANEELITSMSHDIRTPLTVLLGYLDIMKTAECGEQLDGYIKASENTAMRLKELSDDMFNYFLVFGNKHDTYELQEYAFEPLIDQLLSEHILLLRELGYTVSFEKIGLDGIKIVTDAPNTMRIIDNLFSNLKKYADASEPIVIKCQYDKSSIILDFENRQRLDANDVESSGIGLKTCKKLAELLSLGFSYGEMDGRFKTRIVFPTV